MEIRNASIEDLNDILEIYDIARKFMKKTGNPNQWKDTNPTLKMIMNDFENKQNYVILNGKEIVGVFAFIIGEDLTYQIIADGKWLNDKEYGTIHRIASKGEVHHIFETALAFCEERINNIRIDTHKDNIVMQHKIINNGFKYCGIIYQPDGSERLAYQKYVE